MPFVETKERAASISLLSVFGYHHVTNMLSRCHLDKTRGILGRIPTDSNVCNQKDYGLLGHPEQSQWGLTSKAERKFVEQWRKLFCHSYVIKFRKKLKTLKKGATHLLNCLTDDQLEMILPIISNVIIDIWEISQEWKFTFRLMLLSNIWWIKI